MKRALLGSLLLHLLLLLGLSGFDSRVPVLTPPAFSVQLLPAGAVAAPMRTAEHRPRPAAAQTLDPGARALGTGPAVASPGKRAAPPPLPPIAGMSVPAPTVAANGGGSPARKEGAGPVMAPAGAAATVPGASEKPVPDHGLQIRFRPKPPYPALSRELGEEGVVMLRLTVNAASQLEQVQVLRSSGFVRLDRAARDGVSRWRFEAAVQEGQAVSATLELPVHFRLDEL